MPGASIAPVQTTEGDSGITLALWTITRTDTSVAEDFYVQWSHSGRGDGTGGTTNGTDFQNSGSTVAIQPNIHFDVGQASATFTIAINGDTTVETDETYLVQLYSVPAYSEIQRVYGTILNDDGASSLAIAGVTANEGNDGGLTDYAFTVTRSGSTVGTASANYTIANVGTDAADFFGGQPADGTVTFADGESTAVIHVSVFADAVVENNESFTVTLASPTNAAIGTASATGTIVNDDSVGNVSVGNASITEGDSGNALLTFTVTRSGGNSAFMVSHTTADIGGGAVAGTDYFANSSNLSFAADQNTATFQVAVRGDYTIETDENFAVNLSGVTNGGTLVQGAGSGVGSATGTIVNNDAVGNVSIGNASITEGDAGTSILSFTVTRSGGNAAFSVTGTTADIGGGAVAGTDYFANNFTLNFIAGQNTSAFQVSVRGDNAIEANEAFAVQLSSLTPSGTLVQGAGSGAGTATGTILNDDGTFTISSPNIGEGDSGTRALEFTVTRTGQNDFATTVYTQAVSGTAEAGTDFVSAVTPVTFGIGQTTATVTVTINGDTVVEATEYFTLNVYNNNVGGNLSALRASGTGGIVNDDVPVSTNPAPITSSTPGQPGTLVGTAGNNVFVVGNPGDTIIEGSGGGNDTVYASFSYALNGGAFVETLSTQTHSGTENINLTGNFYAQQIIGNYGNNLLNGNGGADTLTGLKGNDTYAIADANAVIVENGGEGYDTVYSNVSYTLTGTAEIEELSFTTQAGTENLNLIGNGFSQKVIGNFGSNVINGNGGVDTLIGLQGDDIYVVGNAGSVVVENGGEGNDLVYSNVSYTLAAGASIETLSTQTHSDTTAINLKGNEVAQTVVGNNGANVIDGGAGADMLVGLGGADVFAFSTALGATNVDTISDFGNGADKIQLSASVFTGLTAGALGAGSFVAGTAATTAAPQVIYDQATGRIFFDADGSGAGAAMLFANVSAGTTLTADMIAIV